MIAQVIIDLPLLQTNQPYSYCCHEFVQPGMRVVVPFGHKDVPKQGIVIEVTDGEDDSLKEVIEVSDAKPVLNEELLALSNEMAQKTLAFKITCLQTMLPSALNKKFNIMYEVIGDHPQLQQFIATHPYKTMTQKERNYCLKEERQGHLIRHYSEQKRVGIKTEMYIRRSASDKQLNDLYQQSRKNAHAWRHALMQITQLSTEWQKELPWRQKENISLTHIKKAEEMHLVQRKETDVYRNVIHEVAPSKPLTLNEEQRAAYQAIKTSFEQQREDVFLLEGITGSGKTEVYMQLIASVLNDGKTALVLVPEIALTPQMTKRFVSRFGKEVAVLHSQLSEGEKYDEWRRINEKEARIVVGARSAIFAPLEHIGLIIIDEEHETTYKQEEMPRYHARDIAIWRGKYHHCPVVLGSATPSLETKARAMTGVYRYVALHQRANEQATLPQVYTIDLAKAPLVAPQSSFSLALVQKIQATLARNEQVVLLLNRRGYSSFMMCRDCGEVLQCPHCDISLTLHMDSQAMVCHYCGHTEPIPHRCPVCYSPNIRYYGTGTEKVEQELLQLFPNEAVIRMDVDTTRKKGAHERLLQSFENKEARILLGTQMIAKGLDFPDVTLVGVLNADTSLYLPDFRSSERTFQLLTQVSGRAGRGEKQGEVYIQTYNPTHYAIQCACRHDYTHFFQQEMKLRHLANYPPYFYTISITLRSEDEKLAQQYAKIIKEALLPYLDEQATIIGPGTQPQARIKKQYYYQMLIKYKTEGQLMEQLALLIEDMQRKERNGLYITVDREPTHFI